MTKATTPNPQPTSNTPYGVYLWPRAKDARQQWIYDRLAELGWRFDARTALWWTPENGSLQGCGALEYANDFSWFRIQPTTPAGSLVRAKPILEMQLV